MAIARDKCTGSVTGRSLDYGQFFYECKICKKEYCQVCWTSCHVATGHTVARRWSMGTYCDCLETPEECASHEVSVHEEEEEGIVGPPAKRTKLE